MYRARITGKWNAMLHSSPLPKYATESSGHMFASASSIGRELRVDVGAQPTQELVALLEVLAVRALASKRYGTASRRTPSTPISNHWSITQHRLLHRRVVEVEVRLVVETVPVVLPAWRLKVQFEGSKSLKMMRTLRYFSSVSLQT